MWQYSRMGFCLVFVCSLERGFKKDFLGVINIYLAAKHEQRLIESETLSSRIGNSAIYSKEFEWLFVPGKWELNKPIFKSSNAPEGRGVRVVEVSN